MIRRHLASTCLTGCGVAVPVAASPSYADAMLASPPEHDDLLLPGCPRDTLSGGCAWPLVERALLQSIDPRE